MERKRSEEIGMLKEMLLFMCNKTHEDYYSDPFIRAVITQISILIGDLRHKTSEQYIKDYRESQVEQIKRIEELRGLGKRPRQATWHSGSPDIHQ